MVTKSERGNVRVAKIRKKHQAENLNLPFLVFLHNLVIGAPV